MKRMLELQDTEDDAEFLNTLRLDLFADEVFVFTPKGEVIELPKGATSIDFAYAIHTEVGHHCSGARVDGKLVPLSHQLSSGETIEVMTSKSGGPSAGLAGHCRHARGHATRSSSGSPPSAVRRRWPTGKDYLIKALRRASLPVQKMVADGSLEAVALELKFPTLDAAVRGGRARAGRRPPPWSAGTCGSTSCPTELEPPAAPVKPRTKPTSSRGVRVEGCRRHHGQDGPLLHAGAARPDHGLRDPGQGSVGPPGGLPERHAAVDSRAGGWSVSPGTRRCRGSFAVEIQIEALDRPKLLRDVTDRGVRHRHQHPERQQPGGQRPGDDPLHLRDRQPLASWRRSSTWPAGWRPCTTPIELRPRGAR